MPLESAIRRAGAPCHAMADGMAVRIDKGTVFEPDAHVYCGPELPGDVLISENPIIVVEVISPTLTMMQLWDREQICLANGAKEFWVADPGLRIVKVTTPDGRTVTYREGDEIPLPIFGSEAKIKVSEIFRY